MQIDDASRSRRGLGVCAQHLLQRVQRHVLISEIARRTVGMNPKRAFAWRGDGPAATHDDPSDNRADRICNTGVFRQDHLGLQRFADCRIIRWCTGADADHRHLQPRVKTDQPAMAGQPPFQQDMTGQNFGR